MTGNIIVSTCCLGDMAVNAPQSEGAALGLGAFTAISPSQTCANYYLFSRNFLSNSSAENDLKEIACVVVGGVPEHPPSTHQNLSPMHTERLEDLSSDLGA